MSDTATTPDAAPDTKQDERQAYIDGLRALADFLEATPDAPTANSTIGLHINDAGEYDAAAAALDGNVWQNGDYEHCDRKFGPITYGFQTNGRAAWEIKQRESRVAERERELGIAS